MTNAPEIVPKKLIVDIRALIANARVHVARAANTALTLLYWQIGTRIRTEILAEKRAAYGENIFQTLSGKLKEYGDGFGKSNLASMVKFSEYFPTLQIVQTLSGQLSWSHFLEILQLKDELKRNFYTEMCRLEQWSVRILREKIDGMLYERTALSKKPGNVIKRDLKKLQEQGKLTPDLVFRDPYILNFLGLKGSYLEKDLENGILREMEAFILELGVGFTFVARQKRIRVGGDDFFIDLLFYHRKLRRLVAVELKLGKFRPADKGQIELYLRWLDKHEREDGEESPIGLILCADKSDEQIELLELEKSGIRLAQYLTELPPRPLLEKKLHQAIHHARERVAVEYRVEPASEKK